ncbi:MAG: thiosulfate/3-mercaptopyruvate sulfurtransferase [Woeseiaceae bacterium]|jgi:thiosulfate/3-mercaptopyruvate sulfurtransferase|tara:strand:- start:1497 stop:2342 length:846 start_codon:yes stop_codon:yes gene_type:complete
MLDNNVLITPSSLVDCINNNNYVIIDTRFSLIDPCQGQNSYNQGHIPNAVYAHLDNDLAGKITPLTGRHPLPDINEISALFRMWGISKESHVIVYDDSNSAIAARLWWLLRWLGHKRVSVLDGGMKAWLSSDFTLTQLLPVITEGDFEASTNTLTTWSTEMIEQWLLNKTRFLLVDARDKDRFSGTSEPIDKIAGHIPNAINIPFMDFVNPDGSWKEQSIVKKIFANKNITNCQDWGVMCGSGVTACHLSISAVIAGITEPALYPGSWSEWITDNRRVLYA